MTHVLAYRRRNEALAKCGVACHPDDAVAFGGDCPACTLPGAWPSEQQQIDAGFVASGGRGPFDKLLRRR